MNKIVEDRYWNWILAKLSRTFYFYSFSLLLWISLINIYWVDCNNFKVDFEWSLLYLLEPWKIVAYELKLKRNCKRQKILLSTFIFFGWGESRYVNLFILFELNLNNKNFLLAFLLCNYQYLLVMNCVYFNMIERILLATKNLEQLVKKEQILHNLLSYQTGGCILFINKNRLHLSIIEFNHQYFGNGDLKITRNFSFSYFLEVKNHC